MKIIRSFGPIESKKPAVVMAIGFFDGLHLGHQRVIEMCREQATAHNAEAWVMTFDPHPVKVLRPATAPRLLTTSAQKLDLLHTMNIDGVIEVPFTRTFSMLSPEQFLRELHSHLPGLRGIVVGRNWRFGHNAAGNTGWLRERAPGLPFDVTVAEHLETAGQIVSSSRLREAIAAGHLDAAAAMLGRNHAVRGTVIDGLKRGRRLGFPTANLDLTGFALPPPGIYAARAHRKGHAACGGAVYLPANPAVAPGLLEVHVIDFDGNLYGQELTVEFVRKIRDDNLRFSSEDQLVRQIASDVANIRRVLERHD